MLSSFNKDKNIHYIDRLIQQIQLKVYLYVLQSIFCPIHFPVEISVNGIVDGT